MEAFRDVYIEFFRASLTNRQRLLKALWVGMDPETVSDQSLRCSGLMLFAVSRIPFEMQDEPGYIK